VVAARHSRALRIDGSLSVRRISHHLAVLDGAVAVEVVDG
jgi:hypothetical protein